MRLIRPDQHVCAATHRPSLWNLPAVAALLLLAGPSPVRATPITSAANIPYSGFAPGNVDMATGELIIVCPPDLRLDGPMPLAFERYYGSMLVREGFAAGHLGPNWLGSFDWSLSVGSPGPAVVTNRGQRLQFQANPVGGWDLVSPTDQKYRLDSTPGSWRLTDPTRRRLYMFDAATLLLTAILDAHGNSLNLVYASGARLSQVNDGLGRALSFVYDATGLLIQVSDGTRSVGYAYTTGPLSSVVDAAGHTTTYSYAAAELPALLRSTTEPAGNTPMTYSYDFQGRVRMMADAYGNTSTYGYGPPSGNLWTDALGHAWTFVHDAQSRLTTLVDPAAGSTSYTYDPLGRLASAARPLGDATSFAYDPASGYPATLTLGDGSVFGYGYSSHAVTGATFYDLVTASYPDGASEHMGRDAAGNLTDLTDRGGFHWLATYNARGQALSGTNPTGGVTTFSYDPQGRLATGADNAGHTTSYSYDALSRLTQVTWPDGPSRSFAYDNLDDVTTLTDERGKLWTYAYDNDGRLVTETDPLLGHSSMAYDLEDRLSQVLDPLDHSTSFAYDVTGRLASWTDRTGHMTQYQYDALGRPIGTIDPSGAPTVLTYDANGRATGVQDALGHSAAYQYDVLDRLTHLTDPVGSGVDYGYDSMGRLTSANAPLGHTTSLTYDARGLSTAFFDVTAETDFLRTALGEVSQRVDPNRARWPATYDLDGRLATLADPLGRTSTYAYDARGRVMNVQLPLGTEDLVYDAASRPTTRNFSDGTLLGYSWDDANRPTGATGATFTYDAAGRMTSSNGLAIARDAEGRITSETYAPGKVVSYTYDSRGLLKGVTDWIGGTTSFAYDTTGQLIGLLRPDGTSASYQYDAVGRLSQQVENKPPPSGSPLATIVVTRDALGRATGINRSQPLMPGVAASGTTNFAYDPASQITGYSYDALGRLTGDGARTFQWDGASRLKGYVSGAETPTFTYDAYGNPLSRALGATNEQYLWNYANGAPTLDVAGQGGTPGTYYIHAPSGLLLHSIDAMSGARSFYHYDEDGNTIYLTDDTGGVTTRYGYSPSGAVMTAGPASGNPFTFGGAGGMMQIGSSGLFRMGGAIYDAMTSRIVSGGATQSGADMVSAKPPPNGSPMGSPGDWVMSRPPPQGSPGAWVMIQRGPSSQTGDGLPTESIQINYHALVPNYRLQDGGEGVSDGLADSWGQLGPVQSGAPVMSRSHQPITSVVVGPGPGGDEIYTDKHSRVKVAFHWDRLGGPDPKNPSHINWKHHRPATLDTHPLRHAGTMGFGSGGAEGKRSFDEILVKPPVPSNPWELANPSMKNGFHFGTGALQRRPWTRDVSPCPECAPCPWCVGSDGQASGEPSNDFSDVNR